MSPQCKTTSTLAEGVTEFLCVWPNSISKALLSNEHPYVRDEQHVYCWELFYGLGGIPAKEAHAHVGRESIVKVVCVGYDDTSNFLLIGHLENNLVGVNGADIVEFENEVVTTNLRVEVNVLNRKPRIDT